MIFDEAGKVQYFGTEKVKSRFMKEVLYYFYDMKDKLRPECLREQKRGKYIRILSATEKILGALNLIDMNGFSKALNDSIMPIVFKLNGKDTSERDEDKLRCVANRIYTLIHIALFIARNRQDLQIKIGELKDFPEKDLINKKTFGQSLLSLPDKLKGKKLTNFIKYIETILQFVKVYNTLDKYIKTLKGSDYIKSE